MYAKYVYICEKKSMQIKKAIGHFYCYMWEMQTYGICKIMFAIPEILFQVSCTTCEKIYHII